MSIVIERSGNTARVRLAGELTIYSVAEIKAAFADGFTGAMKSADQIEVDLSAVSEMDTAGLQLMLIIKRSKEARFVNHPPCVLRLIDLANLGGVFGDPLFIAATESARSRP